jgi:hypothetical protein
VAVGAESSTHQRLARDADRARFACGNCEYVGQRDKFGGACRSDKFAVSVPRDFSPQNCNPAVICSSGLFGGSPRVALTCLQL